MQKKTAKNAIWVGKVDHIILARIRGDLTPELFFDLSHQISQLVSSSNLTHILVDALDMNPPEIDVPMLQWNLNEEQKPLNLRRAIVVRNSRMAYLARLAFGEANYRIFYEDLPGAMKWLSEDKT